MLKIAISGAAGRMGARLIDLGHQSNHFQIVDAVDSPKHPKLGEDIGPLSGIGPIDVPLAATYQNSPEAVIDFSIPAGADQAIDFCMASKTPLVMATTGLEESSKTKLDAAAKDIPIVFAPSMSLAVNLSMKMVEMASQALKDHSSGVDVEIIERHHRYKADSPSGTALKFGEIIASVMGQTNHQHGREGIVGQRPQNEIGYHAVRTGDNPGEHTIVFGMLGETIELKVAASNRDCYAAGALAAAAYVASQQPGMYDMYDVLGF